MGSTPRTTRRRYSCTNSLASASVTSETEPSPCSVTRLVDGLVYRNAHRRTPLGRTNRYKDADTLCRPGGAASISLTVRSRICTYKMGVATYTLKLTTGINPRARPNRKNLWFLESCGADLAHAAYVVSHWVQRSRSWAS